MGLQLLTGLAGHAAAATTATFGTTTVGTATSTPGAGYKFGSIYSLNQAGTAVSFSWYTRGTGSSQKITPIIYAVGPTGNPSTLVAKGAEVTVAANQGAGWVTSSLPSVSLVHGSYLLGLLSGPTGSQVVDYYNVVTNAGVWNANTYGTPTTTWGTVNRENSSYSFYVTYVPSVTVAAPANTSPPTISGTPQVGQTLTASPGSWTNSPTSYAYQWQRCAGTTCSTIPGATAVTYNPTTSDVADTLDVLVTAGNGGGSGQATSAATATVQAAPPTAPTNTTAPSVGGTPAIGQVLTASQGTWSGNPAPSFAYQWQDCSGTTCTDIAGATATTYTVAASDGGFSVRVVVTGTNTAGSVTANSAATTTIATPAAPTNQTPPAVAGNAVSGQTLTTTLGTWSGSPSPSLQVQWQSCAGATCTDIVGATATTYTATSSDVGQTLRSVVTAKNASGTVATPSAETGVVTAPAAVTTLGTTSIGGQTSTPGAGYKFGSVYTLSNTALATDFKWYARGGTASQSFTPIIYKTDGSGNPTTLVTTGTTTTVAAGQAAGWVTASLPKVTLQPGGYLLGLLSGGTGSSAFTYYTAVSNTRAADYNNNGSLTAPSTWGTNNFTNQQWSFYLDYQAASGTTSPPANLSVPAISGSPIVGQTLTGTTGTWSNSPTSFTYQWQNCVGTCTNISGATSATYGVNAADVGKAITVVVTATNSAGSASAASAATAAASQPSGINEASFTRYVIDQNPPGAVVEKALADIQGNGKLDPVIGTEPSPNVPGATGGIYWYEYPGTGVTGTWIRHTIIATSNSAYEDMQAVDMDGDGRIDIVATVGGVVSWFKNPGSVNGAWTQTVIGSGYGEDTIRLGDIDGDGKLDIVTNKYVFFQNSVTNWTRVQVGSSFLGAALLDIGSGLGADNIVTTQTTPTYEIGWYRNPREVGGNARTGTWAFFPIGPSSHSNAESDTVSTGDFNGDGRMDVVAADSEQSSSNAGLRWFEAPSDRTTGWTLHSIDTTYQYAHKIQVVDMDGNGALDLVTAEQDQSAQRRVSIFYNDGKGNFVQQVLSNNAGHNLIVGDINGDGSPDIFNSPHGYYGGSRALEIYINQR